jgi:threonine synthase
MDIIISSNFERYLYDLVESPKDVEDYINQLKANQEIYITELNDQTTFHAFYATESDTLKTIKDVYEQYGYLIDPHTAVGYHCYQQYQKQTKDNHYHVVLSTASPFKFSDAMITAMGLESKPTLAENIHQLKELAPNQFDTRVMNVVDGTVTAKTLSKSEAIHVIKKVIGDIDAKN